MPRIRIALVLPLLASLLALACGGRSIEEIRALQDAGAYQESIEPLREMLRNQPDHPEASYRLGLALLRTGEPAQSLWPLKRASEDPEFGRPAGLILASTLLTMHNFEESMAAASRVLELDPQNEAALLTRARAGLQANRAEDSLADADTLIGIDADNVEALSTRAAALLALERMDEAEKAFDATWSAAQEQESPAAPRACVMRGLFYGKRQDAPRAMREIGACVEEFKDDEQVVGVAVQAYDEMGKGEEGNALLRATLDQKPGDAAVRSMLARRLENLGQVKEADALLLEGAKASNDLQLWMALATVRRRHRDLAGAREALESALAAVKEQPEGVRVQLADVLVDQGELERAEAMSKEFKEPLFRDLIAGRLALERGEPARALEILEKVIVTWPNNENARVYAARAASEAGDVERAMRQLREAARIAPSESDGAMLLARLHLAQGEPQAAIELGTHHIRHRGFTGPEAHVVLGRANIALQRWPQAREILGQLRQVQGQEALAVAELADVDRAELGVERAIQTIESSKLDLAEPANAVALARLVELQIEAGRPEKALATLDALARRKPTASHPISLRAQVLARMGRHDEARAAYARALELDPNDALALGGQGYLAQVAGDAAAAVALFDRAAKSDPNQPLYAYAAAQALLISGDAAGAEKRFVDVVHRFPENAAAANDLAYLLADRGESLEFALQLAKRAQAKLTGPEVLDTVGWVHYQRGESEPAVKAFRDALALRSDYATARYHLGLALAKQGDTTAAREELRTALATGDFPEQNAARTELARLEQTAE